MDKQCVGNGKWNKNVPRLMISNIVLWCLKIVASYLLFTMFALITTLHSVTVCFHSVKCILLIAGKYTVVFFLN